MAYIHHSFVRCDDCGEQHYPGNKESCIEVLLDRINGLEEDLRLLSEDAARLREELDEERGIIR